MSCNNARTSHPLRPRETGVCAFVCVSTEGNRSAKVAIYASLVQTDSRITFFSHDVLNYLTSSFLMVFTIRQHSDLSAYIARLYVHLYALEASEPCRLNIRLYTSVDNTCYYRIIHQFFLGNLSSTGV